MGLQRVWHNWATFSYMHYFWKYYIAYAWGSQKIKYFSFSIEANKEYSSFFLCLSCSLSLSLSSSLSFTLSFTLSGHHQNTHYYSLWKTVILRANRQCSQFIFSFYATWSLKMKNHQCQHMFFWLSLSGSETIDILPIAYMAHVCSLPANSYILSQRQDVTLNNYT